MKTFHFLSGLPRSGSTLLSALLNQNPKIHASTNSPVLDTIHYTEEYLLYNSEQYKAHPKPTSAHKVLSSIAPNYYFDTPENIIIDKSRGWVNQISHITDYITPNPKIICPVRNIQDIMVSFLCLIHKNSKTSFIDEGLIRNGLEINNDNRCDYLMSSQGIIGMSYNALYEAFTKGHQDKILLIEYDNLVRNPQKELNRIYDFIEEDGFSHSFENIVPKYDENDEVYQLENMHFVRDKVEKIHRDNEKYLSNYIINKYKHMEFWRRTTPQYSIFGLQ
jgi:sulfotransferase